jgi:hypothetical protein
MYKIVVDILELESSKEIAERYDCGYSILFYENDFNNCNIIELQHEDPDVLIDCAKNGFGWDEAAEFIQEI